MLSRNARLTHRTFSPLFRRGTRFRGSWFDLIYAHNTKQEGAVVVSKKVAKTAVVRNAVRRKIYHTLSHFFLNTTYDIAVIVMIRRLPSPKEYEELFSALLSLHQHSR